MSKVRPYNFKHDLYLNQYKLPGYNMESLNIKEDIGRGNVSIDYSSFDVHQFVNNVNEAQTVSIELDEGSLLFCALYRSSYSDDQNDKTCIII